MRLTLLSVFLLLLAAIDLSAQDVLTAHRLRQAKAVYNQQDVTRILSGKAYNLKYLGAINTQFYQSMYPEPGTMIYDGITFDSLDMQIDLYTQEVVVLMESPHHSQYMTVDRQKVDYMHFMDFTFVKIKGDSVMADGLYEEMFTGDSNALYAKREVFRKQFIDSGRALIDFIPNHSYYITNANGTFRIQRKKDLLTAYPQSPQLLKTLKKNKIKLSKKRFEQGLLKAIHHVDSSLKLPPL